MIKFLDKNKNILIFIVTYFVITFIDVVVFGQLFPTLFSGVNSWILDNTFLSIIIFFWMFIGVPSIVAYFVGFMLIQKKIEKAPETSTSEPAFVNPPEKKSDNNQSKIVIITICVLGIATIILIRFLTQPIFSPYTFQDIQPGELSTPNPTANWKTYNSQAYGFSFKYPSDWEPTEYKNPSSSSNPIFQVSFPTWLVSVEIYHSNLSLERYISSQCLPSGQCLSSKNATDITVDSINAKEYSSFPEGVPNEVVAIKKDNYIYQINHATTDTSNHYTDEQLKTLFDKILSTFQFTKPPSASPPVF